MNSIKDIQVLTNFGQQVRLLFKLHIISSVDSEENHENGCHQRPDFIAKVHQNRFRLPNPAGGAILREREGRRGKGGKGKKGRREGREREGRGRESLLTHKNNAGNQKGLCPSMLVPVVTNIIMNIFQTYGNKKIINVHVDIHSS